MNSRGIHIILIFLFLAIAGASAQNINILWFDAALSYGPGSGVSLIINPTDTFTVNNKFVVELSDNGGTWNNPQQIKEVTEFYTPVINAILPANITNGRYKLRIRSTNPVWIEEAPSFEVKTGNVPAMPTVLSSLINNSNYFNCLDSSNTGIIFGSLNQQAGSTTAILNQAQRTLSIYNFNPADNYQILLIDVLNNNQTTLTQTNGNIVLPANLKLGTYVLQIVKTNTLSSVASVVFLFHGNGTNLGNSSSEEICVNNSVFFGVDTSIQGIGRNYKGSKYVVNFGDGSKATEYTQNQLINNPVIEHVFTKASCSESGSSFLVQVQLQNKGIMNSCSAYVKNGNGVSKAINVSVPPAAEYKAPVKSCINKQIFFENTTIPGFYGKVGCKEASNFYWYYKKPGATDFTLVTNKAWIDTKNNLTIPATAVDVAGCWEIRIEAQNQDLCQIISSSVKTIMVEPAATSVFEASADSICTESIVSFTNKSNVLNLSCSEPAYNWTVETTTSNGYEFSAGTTATSPNTSIKFNKPGKYTVKLKITNICGTVISTAKDIYVAGGATVSLPADSLSICVPANEKYTHNFSSAANKPLYNSNYGKIASYKWEISGDNVSKSDYTFLNGTDANSAFPVIEFNSMKKYRIKISIESGCNSANFDEMDITINKIPELKLTESAQTICSGSEFNSIVLNSQTENSGFVWTVQKSANVVTNLQNGSGNAINGCVAVNNSDITGTITLKIKPTSGFCAGNEFAYTIYVLPSPTVNKIENMTVCNESLVEVKFSSNISSEPIQFNWWTDNTENGMAKQGTGDISFVAKNSGLSPLSTIVYYKSVLTKNGKSCESNTGSFILTVQPTPQTEPVQNITVCAGQKIDKIVFKTKNSGVETTYSWKNSAPEIGVPETGTGNIEAFIAQNNSDKPITASIKVLAEIASGDEVCDNEPTSFDITVNPSAKAHFEGESEVCQGSTDTKLHIICSNGKAPYSVSYSLNNGTIIQSSSVIGNDTITIDVPTINTGKLTYKIHTVSDSDPGSCVNFRTDSAVIVIAENPMIATQPVATQTVCKGSDADTLKVIMSGGAGTPKIQWFSNNTPQNYGGKAISGATSSVYVPKAFAVTGDYYFYCTVTTNGSNCGSATSDIAHVKVIDLPRITKQSIAMQEVCRNSIPVKLQIEAEGDSAKFSYQWYKSTKADLSDAVQLTGATDNNYLPSTEKTGTAYYYCEVNQKGKGCVVASNVSVVNTLSDPAITSQPLSQSACKNDLSGKLTVSYSGGSNTAAYQWFINTQKSSANGIKITGATTKEYRFPTNEAGVFYYYVQVYIGKDSCSVLNSEVAEITVNQLPVISNKTIEVISGQRFTLIPENNGTDVVPANTLYSWPLPQVNPESPITGMTAQTSGKPSVSDLLTNSSDTVAGVRYAITPENNGCRGNTFYLNVMVLPALSIKAKKQDISCFDDHNGQIEVNIFGGIRFKAGSPYNVTWNGPNGFTSANLRLSNLHQGEYTLTVRDSVGAEIIQKFIIDQPEKLTITTDNFTKTNCSGENSASISVNVNGGKGKYAFRWLKNDILFAETEDIKNLSEGKYTLTVTDENGCTATSTVYEITSFEPIAISVTEQLNNNCFNGTNGSIKISVKGGTQFDKAEVAEGYKFNWTGTNFTSTEKDLTNLAGGIYDLTVTDKNGCSATLKVNILQPDEIKITAYTTPVSCFGKNDATVTLDVKGGKAPYQAEWSNYASGLYQENVAPGEYTIKVTDANKCEKTILVKIEDETRFTVIPAVRQISCNGARDGSIHLSIKSNRSTMKVKWLDGSTAGTDRNNLAPGVYNVEVSDGGPCVITNSFVISEPAKLEVTADIKNAFGCEASNSGSVKVKVIGGNAPYTYLWSNGSTDSIASGLLPGKHFVTVTDKNGCSVTEAYDLIRHDLLKVNITSKTAFSNTLNRFKEICTAEVSGGVTPYRYQWSAGEVSNTNNAIMETLTSQTIELTVTDAMGCSVISYFKTNIPENQIESQVVDCNNQVYKFDIKTPPAAFTNLVYNWDFGDGGTSNIKSPTHIFLKSGDYTVKLRITSNEGNLDFATNMTVEALPVLKLDREPRFCKDDSVELIVSGAESYLWNDGTRGNRKVIKREGNYSVVGISANGCTSTLNFTAQYYDYQNYTIQTDKNVLTLNDPTLKVWSENVNLTNYSWNFGDESTMEGNFADHTYDIDSPVTLKVKLNVVNPWGCTETAEKTVWLIMESIPNTFTPNEDGVNDRFLKGTKVQIFNSNGIILYEGTEGWDGTYKGKRVAMDTYYYVVYYSTPEGIVNKPGFVFLAK